ncbi:hypothetical protein Moror_9548 [Moniliophthora roreri MCA 2997]|nr:hypothetical protein Moror_9548 [Moniliophthora roreri MCA 2997]
MIFIRYLPTIDVSDPTFPSIFHTFDSPITLTHVCRNWRLLADSIPALWTRIRIHFFTSSGKVIDVDTLERCLRAWIFRSQTLPLRVDLFVTDSPHSENRWNISIIPPDPRWDIFWTAYACIPWERVEHLGMQGLGTYPQEYAAVLMKCTAMKPLIILDAGHIRSQPFPEFIRLSQLKSLRMRSSKEGIQGRDALKYLIAPMVEEITLEIPSRAQLGSSLMEILKPFLIRSGVPRVRKVTLAAWSFNQLFIDKDLAKRLEFVEDLTFAIEEVDFFLKETFRFLSDPSIMPNLSRLSIGGVCRQPAAALALMETRALEHVKMKLAVTDAEREDTANRLEALGKWMDISGIDVMEWNEYDIYNSRSPLSVASVPWRRRQGRRVSSTSSRS